MLKKIILLFFITFNFCLYADPVAYWNFDESVDAGVAYDSIAANNGTLHNGVSWQNYGYSESAYYFDGTNDYIEISNENYFDLDNITICCWVLIDGFTTSYQTIISKGSDSYIIRRNASEDSLMFKAGTKSVYGTVKVNDSKWHFITAVHNGIEVKLYIDGILDVSDITTSDLPSNSSPVWIGAEQINGRYFKGIIDEVQIYDYGMTTEQVKDLYLTSGGSMCMEFDTGDVNLDCVVDFTDYVEIAKKWLNCSYYDQTQCPVY